MALWDSICYVNAFGKDKRRAKTLRISLEKGTSVFHIFADAAAADGNDNFVDCRDDDNYN